MRGNGMAEVAAIISLIASGVIKLKDPCASPGCRITPKFECPSCKTTYCPQHASEIDFECKKCHRKLTSMQAIPVEI